MARRFVVGKSFDFQSAHRLVTLPEDHPCSNLHGHSYKAEIVLSCLEACLDQHGMVLDFNVFKPLKAILDHRNLNDVFLEQKFLLGEKPAPTTSESLSLFIWDWTDKYIWQTFGAEARKDIQILRVRVSETESSFSELVVES